MHGDRPEFKKGHANLSEEGNQYGMSTTATGGSNGTRSLTSATGVPTGSIKSVQTYSYKQKSVKGKATKPSN